MSGIYLHIPFCKKRCTYCDFYTEVAPQLVPKLVNSLVRELEIRHSYLKNEPVSTIYFGGGTPSQLNKVDFKIIFDAIYRLFDVEDDVEITFEANPDDLTKEYLESIESLPFNRISMGIQSFDDADLRRLNRRHTSAQAIEAVLNAKEAGFKNISIDLIYGLPFQTMQSWEKQLDTAMRLNIQHLSAYGLTYEEGTVLWKQREKGEINVIDDETMTQMYDCLLHKTIEKGFERYEISNFSLPDYQSKHNRSYWQQVPYLGIGPSAHSYDIFSRQWNIASTREYMVGIENGVCRYEHEKLSENDRYNDYVMTALRTSNGIELSLIETQFGADYMDYCISICDKFLTKKKIELIDNRFCLTPEGINISNLILADLMKV